MKKLLERISKIFSRKNNKTVYDVCNRATGEIGQYCTNELHYR